VKGHDLAEIDVIVIGGGHAGTEAAAASARLGARTVLLTQKKSTIGEMSCNPAIGGLGKGHLVREIDALDGIMAKAADASGIQFRVLNRSKGPAVRGPRVQADRALYRQAVQRELEQTNNLTVMEGSAEDICQREDGSVVAVVTDTGAALDCRAVVLTTGTFLRGVIHCGERKTPAGRFGDAPAAGLSLTLERMGFCLSRLKTGTPPRLNGKTINWAAVEKQPGDEPPEPLSTLTTSIPQRQVPCYITHTNTTTHEIITRSLHKSPIYSGQIECVGPRYCPSIEDKIVRFADRQQHQIFLEPEGLDTDWVYPNGISTSLPEEIQKELVQSILGLEQAVMVRPGYAIEYDHVDARELKHTLESRKAPGLFMAGQIAGTTGYEEAAGQGLVAGINAALRAEGQDREFVVDRAEGYLGVMIDDLVTKELSEPYRMFTSRAEYRLQLRADNADMRLTQKGLDVGCIGPERQKKFEEKRDRLSNIEEMLQSLKASPTHLTKAGIAVNLDGIPRSAYDLLGNRDLDHNKLSSIWPELRGLPEKYIELVKTDALYASYIQRQEADIRSYRKDESLVFPKEINFDLVGGLSNEARQALEKTNPQTLGQAARIPGITPAAVVTLLRHVKATSRRERQVVVTQ